MTTAHATAAVTFDSTLSAGDSTFGVGSAATGIFLGKSGTDTYGILSFNGVNTNTGMVGFAGTSGDLDFRYRVPTGGSHLFRVNNTTTLQLQVIAGKTILTGTAWPTAAAGLAAGTLWNNGGVLNVAP